MKKAAAAEIEFDEREAAQARLYELQAEAATVKAEIERLSQPVEGSGARGELLDRAAERYIDSGELPDFDGGARLDEAALKRLHAQQRLLARALELARQRVVQATDKCSRAAQAAARDEVLAVATEIEQAVAAMRAAADRWIALHDSFSDRGLSMGVWQGPPSKVVGQFSSANDWACGITAEWVRETRQRAEELRRAA